MISDFYPYEEKPKRMERCPYIHEMRERLLGPVSESVQTEPIPELAKLIDTSDNQSPPLPPRLPQQSHHIERNGPRDGKKSVGTLLKLNSGGIGAHISPMHQQQSKDYGNCTELCINDLLREFRRPKNAKTSLFIVTSFMYAMLLIVICIASVISDVSTHKLPTMYYEGFFTYLYGASIIFLLYVFCFLLQESSCCNSGTKEEKPPKPVKEKNPKKEKPPKKEDPSAKEDATVTKENKGKAKGKELASELTKKGKAADAKEPAVVDVEKAAPSVKKSCRRRKTTHNYPHGSFFLRIGAIAFGLGTMIYVGLAFGSFFETPFTSPCHQILRGVNPLLQMIFTFMQMYLIFMNARLNIHRFKVLARFGLMHIFATNLCVWIRVLVDESLKEITLHYMERKHVQNPHHRHGVYLPNSDVSQSLRHHTQRFAGKVLGTHYEPNNADWALINIREPLSEDGHADTILSRMIQTTGVTSTTDRSRIGAIVTDTINVLASTTSSTTGQPTTTTIESTTAKYITSPTVQLFDNLRNFISTTIPSTTTTSTTTIPPPIFDPEMFEHSEEYNLPDSLPIVKASEFLRTTVVPSLTETISSTVQPSPRESLFEQVLQGIGHAYQTHSDFSHIDNDTSGEDRSIESFESIYPAALVAPSNPLNTSCGRINIMGTFVQDSTPYLYPFIIEYSLIGAVVIYVMWRHIGRYPKQTEEDLERRLEVMLSRRAVAMAQAHTGRVDCVGASKGLFVGLLLLVGSLICLILFFVLIHSPFTKLAIYLADASHCVLMAFAVLAIFIGFIRVQTLKFRSEEQSNLNDLLLRISAFGLFVYSVFSVIAGSLNAFESEPNLLVMVTGLLAIVQVFLQLLFIADVSRRRVHLPEHDRTKPGRQIVTFLLIVNIAMFAIYTFEANKVFNNPVQLDFYGYIAWSLIQRITLPLCIFHRFHSAVTLAEIWKTTYKAHLS